MNSLHFEKSRFLGGRGALFISLTVVRLVGRLTRPPPLWTSAFSFFLHSSSKQTQGKSGNPAPQTRQENKVTREPLPSVEPRCWVPCGPRRLSGAAYGGCHVGPRMARWPWARALGRNVQATLSLCS